MLRARSTWPRRTRWSAGTHAGPRDQRLPGTDRSTVNRLAGNRRRGWFWNSGTRTGGRCRHGRSRSAQLLSKIGTRRDYGPRHRLASERAPLLRLLGPGRGLHGSAILRWLRRPLRQCRPRHRRSGRARSRTGGLSGSSRKRLSRAGENLARSRRSARRAGNRFGHWRRRTSRRNDRGRRLRRGRLRGDRPLNRRGRAGRKRWRGLMGSGRRAIFRPQTAAHGRLNGFSGERRPDR